MTTATPANKVDLVDVGRSSTIEARLRVKSSGNPLAGRLVRFSVRHDRTELYSADRTTTEDGVARVDLKQLDVAALKAVVRGDNFVASFAGDSAYCPSSGQAAFNVIRAPV